MIYPTIIRLPSTVTLDLRVAREPRPRVVIADAGDSTPSDPEPVWHEFAFFNLYLVVDAAARTIAAYLPPIPHHLPLYGPEDFLAAAGDSMDDHANRVLQLLGSDPTATLQAMIDGSELPPVPPRIPREIPNWRCKAVLTQMGIIGQVEAIMNNLPEPDRTIAKLAWNGDGKVSRRGKTVLGLSSALGLTDDQVDSMFLAAERIEV